jgi:16S rRNA (guanine527-N7)-methyltransferase
MVSRETPGALPDWLEPRRDVLTQFADLLADVGVTRGLIGPREVPRLWDRHLLNCAVVADPALGLLVAGQRVADVGSGAGLPGLVWAIVRPDVHVILIEPLLRRSTFLAEAIDALGLQSNAQVLRGRAEDVPRDPSWHPVEVVTARAVAPLERLIGWTAPLLAPGGRLLALKGSSAETELADGAGAARTAGLTDMQVIVVGAGVVDPATRVITGVRGAAQ